MASARAKLALVGGALQASLFIALRRVAAVVVTGFGGGGCHHWRWSAPRSGRFTIGDVLCITERVKRLTVEDMIG